MNIQDWDQKKFLCQIHNDSLQLLYFGETPQLKSRLLCAKCIIEIINSEERQPALLYLKDVKIINDNPADQLMKITRINCWLNKKSETEMLEVIENLVSQFDDVVKKQLEMIRQNIFSMRESLQNIDTKLIVNWKINDVLQQFQLLSQMDNFQGTNELKLLEEQLNYISVNLNTLYIKAQEKVKDNQTLIIDNFQNNFKIIQKEYEHVSQQSLEILQNIACLGMPGILYDDLHQFPQIHRQISQGKLINYSLLFQATRDGFNYNAYWDKCDQQTHLLTILTSKNGSRFGGYSPCYINRKLNSYVWDETMKSFVFQYNKKQIYKIKQKEPAVHSHGQQGPTFGQYDICVNQQFHVGPSCLGYSYDISGYDIVNKAHHLFGQDGTALQECKVYKVIF